MPLAEQLSRLIPAERILPEASLPALAIDGRLPTAAVQPATVEEVAAVLAYADREGLAVCPRGGGSQMELGRPPKRCDLVLSTRDLEGIVEYEPADLTVTVRAGTPLGRLQAELMARGQFLPIDPPSAAQSTVGGMLATNASGPLRLAFGPVRDRLIGLRFVRADGAIAKSGGKVVKNVAGYDVHRLMVGGLGTLGVFVEASFKVAPLPQAEATVGVIVRDAGRVFELAGIVRRQVWATLVALEVFDRAGAARLGLGKKPGWLLLVQLAGSVAAVRRQADDLIGLVRAAGEEPERRDASALGAFWQQVRDFGQIGEQSAPVRLKAGVAPSRLAEFVGAVADRPGVAIQARAGTGLAYVSIWPDGPAPVGLVKEMRDLARRLEGHLVIERGPVELKDAVDVWGPVGPEFELMRRIRAQFDPRGTLNPGRFVGGM